MSAPASNGASASNGAHPPANGNGTSNGASNNNGYSNGNGTSNGATREVVSRRLPPRRLAARRASTNGNGTVALSPPSVVAPETAAVPALGDGNGRGGGAPTAPLVATGGGPPGRRKASLADVFVSFRERDFRYLALSTLAVGFGQWAQQIGLFWLVLELTGSSAQLGFIAAFRGGVGTLIAPIGGVLADRYSRRLIMVWSTIAGALLAGVLAALVVTDLIHVWHAYAFALAGGILQSINQPTRQAFVYDVSTDETLPNAIAMNSVVQNVSRVTGPPLTGAMIGFLGVASPFIFIVVVQVIASVMTLLISHNTRQVKLRGGANPFRQIGEGFKYTWQDKRILGLVIVSAIPALLVYPYIPFLAVISEEVLGRGAQGFGFLASMLGWGSIVGLMLLATMGPRLTSGRVMLFCFTIYSAMLIGFSWSTVYPLSLGILAVAGIFHSIGMALTNTLIQMAVRNELRGRVMAVWQMTNGLQPLGSAPMGLLVAAAGPSIGIGSFMIAATVLFVLFTATWGSVRRMKPAVGAATV
ncbi:MAG: MFS transporter [Dehalococcoidia bacterium]